MKRFFLIGFIIVLIIAIIAAVYLAKTNTKGGLSKASASTNLSFNSSTTTIPLESTISVDVVADPGSNTLSAIKLAISYDSTKFSITEGGFTPNTSAFPTILDPVNYGGCTGNMCTITGTLSIGSDPTKVITKTVTVGTLTLKAISATDQTPTSLSFGSDTAAYSTAPTDQSSENILASTNPLSLTITDTSTLSPTPIPTSTPTPTPQNVTNTPTPTIVPSHTSFSMTVYLHDIGNGGDNASPHQGGNQNPHHTQRPITVSVYNNTNTLMVTKTGTVIYNANAGNFSGNIDMGNLASGNYLIKIKSNGFLAKYIPGIQTITSSTTNMLQAIYLVNGDITNDNKLDNSDYANIINCFESKQSTASCAYPPTDQTTGADLDDDGVVNIFDYNAFLREISVQNGEGS